MTLDLEHLDPSDLPVEFGRYTLTGILGEGGMGRVFRAELRGPSGFRKELALKVIARSGSSSDRLREEFFREARFSGLLKHENVVDVYDFGLEDDRPWLAMELLEGRALSSLLRDGPLPPTAALDLGIQLCAGLTHAHGLTVDGEPVELVHRDLKPGNIIVTPRGVAKILDFGLARAAGGSDLTGTGTVRGTPAYMAPEQARLQDLDARTDLFALGLILFETLSGNCLLARDNLMAVMMALVQLDDTLQDPAVLRDAEAAVPGVTPVLTKLLRQDPTERYARASELAGDLRLLRDMLPPGPDLHTVVAGEQPGPASGSVVAAAVIDTLPHASIFPGTQSTRPSQALARRTNLAPDSASFVGRTADLAAMGDAVKAGARLITLVGPGGTGKTRLARRYAAGRLGDLLPFGGVWFCDLSEATTVQGILHVVGMTLGIPLDQAGPEGARELIGHALADRGRMLIILDNAEQIVAHVEEVVEDWLRMAPGLQLIVTSRERLRLPSEQVVDLGPLTDEEAVALFVERAKAVSRGFAMKEADRPAIEEIVHRLDCMPLAIELAAARVSVMAPRKIRDRLSQRFRLLAGGRRSEAGRQSTLKSAIQWSWDLLDPPEQDAFRQCAVFRGGFTLEAAEEVIDLDAHDDAPWTLDVIQALRDKSLLNSRTPQGLGGEVRFGMYESLREFAAERLKEWSGTADVDRRHARAIVEIGEALVPEMEKKEGRIARIQLALELDNLNAAYTRMRGVDAELAVRAVLAMAPMLEASGPMALLGTLLDGAVETAADLDAATLGRLLLWRSKWRRNAGDGPAAADDGDRAIALAREAGDDALLVLALSERAMTYVEVGDPASGCAPSEEAVALARRTGDSFGLGMALTSLAYAVGFSGEREASTEHTQESLELWRRVGNLRREANALSSLAVDRGNRGDIASAEPLFREALKLHRRVGTRRGEAMCQGNLGLVALQRGDLKEARRRVRKANELHRAHGARMPYGATLSNLGCVDLLDGDYEVALERFRESDRIVTEAGHNFYLSIIRRDRAIAAAALGEWEEAEAAARGAVEAAEALPKQLLKPSADTILGAVLAARGQLAEADSLLHSAEVAHNATGDRAEVALVALGMAFRDMALARQLSDADPEAAAELMASAKDVSKRFGYTAADYIPDDTHDSTLRIFKAALDLHLARTEG